MSPRTDTIITFTAAHAHEIGAVLVVGTLLAGLAEIALREKCGLCGERLRMPLEGHWLLNHAGEPRP